MSKQEQGIEEMLMPVFMEASFEAHDGSGRWRISDEKRALLGERLGLSEGQVAAYAYLAALDSEGLYEDLEWDIELNRGDLHE